MEKDSIKRYILSETFVNADSLQEMFGLSQESIQLILDEMINEGTIKYISEHNYIVVFSNNREDHPNYQLANKRERNFIRALWICVNNEKVSISLIQRHILMSYAMTRKAIGWMVENGYVTQLSGRGNYKINLSRDEYIEKFGLPDGLEVFTEKERGEIKIVRVGRLS